jgi:hypothetical protein
MSRLAGKPITVEMISPVLQRRFQDVFDLSLEDAPAEIVTAFRASLRSETAETGFA